MMNMDKVICIGYFVAGYEKNNDVFLHWQHREKCPEVMESIHPFSPQVVRKTFCFPINAWKLMCNIMSLDNK
jgi:hypothetical protein